MKCNVGIWIDHSKAVIVRITGDIEEIHTIVSDMEKHVRYSGEGSEDRQEHRFTNHLKVFYDKIISFLHDADSILILGPGEAKGEFEKRLDAESINARIVGIESTDKMTDHEIAAKVREHFLNTADTIRHNKNHALYSDISEQTLKGEQR